MVKVGKYTMTIDPMGLDGGTPRSTLPKLQAVFLQTIKKGQLGPCFKGPLYDMNHEIWIGS